MGQHKPPAGTLIRPATLDDAADLADLGALVFRHTYGAAIPLAILDAYLARTFTPAALQQALRHNATSYLVATQAGHLVGYSKCAITAPPACVQGAKASELVNLYIHPAHQSNGIGKQLLQQAIQVAAAQHLTTLWLCVWQANQRAVDFYLRFGFTVVGKTEVYVDHVVFDDWVMQKDMRHET
jgi:ribosomal protein S18 acetylase RimI-like enzyme